MATVAAENPIEAQRDTLNIRQTDIDNLTDFQRVRSHLQWLIGDWSSEITETDIRRKTRDVDVDVEKMRKAGEIDEDETLVPVRVCDTNIVREQPAYINYLKNSRRLCIFNCISNPSINSQNLELEFTRGMTYVDWETPFYKEVDGAQTHGWDSVEVVYDESKTLNVGIEHVGHDMLFFPRTCLNIQYAPTILRAYDLTKTQLQKFVAKFGFDETQVNTIINANKDSAKENETVRVYKRYSKIDGVVWVSWFSLENGVSDWLLKPTKFFNGIRHEITTQTLDPMTMSVVPQTEWVNSDVTLYPIFVLPYRETEKPKLVDHIGRVFMDENKQEAQTAILSGFINGLTRASNIYASPGKEDGTGASLKEISGIKLSGGRVLNNPINFWHPDYPDPMVLKALQYFDLANSQETNQPTFAAMNREDSRKTATEMSIAQNQQALLNSVQLTLFSAHLRQIYSYVWLIVQSQALQDRIKFLQIKQEIPQINPLTGQPAMDQMGQPVVQTVWVNDKATISEVYDVRAAGDVDVIQRQEKIQQMKQDWPVIQNTPLRDIFLADLMRLQYPDGGERYAQILMQSGSIQQMQGLIAGLGGVIASLIQTAPEIVQTLPPEQQQQLQQLLAQSQQVQMQMQSTTGGPQ